MKDKKIIDSFLEKENIKKKDFRELRKDINFDNYDQVCIPKKNFKLSLIICACVVVLLALSLTTGLIFKHNYDKNKNINNEKTETPQKTEVTTIDNEFEKKYNEALLYLYENNIDPSSLSNEEIFTLYEDIKSNSFKSDILYKIISDVIYDIDPEIVITKDELGELYQMLSNGTIDNIVSIREEEKYNQIINYLSSNNIDPRDLSKEDVYLLYEDIISGEFSSDITYNVLKEIVHRVEPLYEINKSGLGYIYELIANGNINTIKYSDDYRQALTFFINNGMEYKDYNEEETIELYEDIHTNAFELSDSYTCITATLEKRFILNPLVIEEEEMTKEDIMACWASYVYSNESSKEYKIVYKENDKYFRHYNSDGVLIYSIPIITSGYIIKEFSDFVIVHGYNNRSAYYDDNIPDVLVINKEDGEILGSGSLNDKGVSDQLFVVMDNNDGTFSFLSVTNDTVISLRTFNKKYQLISSQSYDFGKKITISKFGTLGDNYLAVIKSNGISEVVFFDKEMKITDSINYQDGNYQHNIVDCCIYNDVLYVSSFATFIDKVLQEFLEYYYEIDFKAVYAYYNKHNLPINQNEQRNSQEVQNYLLGILDDTYKASLLIMDSETNELREVYSVSGAVGGTLEIVDNDLHWGVKKFDWAVYSPVSSSSRLIAETKESYYLFNGETLKETIETENRYDFYR